LKPSTKRIHALGTISQVIVTDTSLAAHQEERDGLSRFPVRTRQSMKLAKKIAARGYLHEASQDYNFADFLRPFLADYNRIAEKKF